MSTEEEKNLLVRYLRALQKEEDRTRFGDKRKREEEQEKKEGDAKRQANREARNLGTTLPNILQSIPPEVMLHILRESVDRKTAEPKMWIFAAALRAFIVALSITNVHFLTILSDVKAILYALDPPLVRWKGLVHLIETKYRTPQGWINWRSISKMFMDFTGAILVVPLRKTDQPRPFASAFINKLFQTRDRERTEMITKDDIFTLHPSIRTTEELQQVRAYLATSFFYKEMRFPIESGKVSPELSTEQIARCKNVSTIWIDFDTKRYQKHLILFLDSISNNFTLHLSFRLMVAFSKHAEALFSSPLPRVRRVSVSIVSSKNKAGFLRLDDSQPGKKRLHVKLAYPQEKWPHAQDLLLVLPYSSVPIDLEVHRFPSGVKRFKALQYHTGKSISYPVSMTEKTANLVQKMDIKIF